MTMRCTTVMIVVFSLVCFFPCLGTPNIKQDIQEPTIATKTYIMRTLLAASSGLACEIIFTALYDFCKTKNLHLEGATYVWMLAVYACIYPLYERIYPKVAHLRLPVRGILYVCMIYAGEYLSGAVLRKLLGSAPWERYYRNQPWAVHDLIRLDYAPAWFVAGLLFEEVCNTLNAQSVRYDVNEEIESYDVSTIQNVV